MHIIRIKTVTRHEFFDLWKDEVHKCICDITKCKDPVYVVFTGYDSCTSYVYTTEQVLSDASVVNPLKLLEQDDLDINKSATPVYCNPAVEMSTTSFADFDGVAYVEYAEYAIEDVTISCIAKQIVLHAHTYVSQQVQDYNLDKDMKLMIMFVNLAMPNTDTTMLMSFVNSAMVTAGYNTIMYPNVPALKHNMLEVRSEMMRCNPNLYTVYKHKMLDIMLKSIIADSKSKHEMEHRVSGMVYEILSDNVVSCLGTMWCFSDGLWQECAYDGYVWKFLTDDFIEYLQSKGAHKIALHMMSSTVRSRVMKDIKLRLQNDNFYQLLDSKRGIMCMVNGVYDTNSNMLQQPVPSDYVSVVSGVPYQVFDEKSQEVTKLMLILGSIFPDKEILDFFMLSCSTFLEGYNNPKVFYIWWGFGNNAKSLVQTLVMKTFGDYCSTAPTSLVTGQRSNASNATPELCHVEKRLVVFLQEPNPEEMIKAGKVKEMTGNDTMYVRQLFKSGRAITFKAKIVIVCNNIIEIPGMDAAIRRRIVVIPFTSTFLSEAEYNMRNMKNTLEPNSNIINPYIEHDLLSCKSAFMYVLCRKYNEFRDAGCLLNIPQKITNVTEEYVTRHNYPLIFIRNFVYVVQGSAVAVAEAYERFKEWFKRAYPGKRVQDFERFTRELFEEGYKDNGKGIIHNVYVNYTGDQLN